MKVTQRRVTNWKVDFKRQKFSELPINLGMDVTVNECYGLNNFTLIILQFSINSSWFFCQ